MKTFKLKNNCAVLYNDLSEFDIIRKGNSASLRQNMKTVYKDAFDKLNNFEEIPEKYPNVTEFANAQSKLYKMHQDAQQEKKIHLKQLGTMSSGQIKNCKKAIENLLSLVFFNYDRNKSKDEQRFVSFLTLTLPFPQHHTDKIFRKMLTRFLENLQKTYNLQHYIWKAEAQKNGNIHFHLLLDRWIKKEVVTFHWHKQLNKYGYVDKFKQRFGKDKEPPTCKIHSLQHVKNTVAYIMKYMGKVEQGKRPIIGKIWGCSNVTKKLDYPSFNEHQEEFVQILKSIKDERIKDLKNIYLSKNKPVPYDTDFVSIYVGNVFEVIKKRFRTTWNSIKLHYRYLGTLTIDNYKEFERLAKNTTDTVKDFVKQNQTVEQGELFFTNQFGVIKPKLNY